MEKIDVKDRKILYQLDLNSRQSFRSIGRKVGLSKDVVASRVKKLQEKEILKRFYTRFDNSKLGLSALRFYFKYQYITPEIKKEIVDHFVNCKYSTIVASIEGSYDLLVLMLVKNLNNIYPFWQKTLIEYGDYFSDRVFSVYEGESVYRKSFLLDEKDDRTKLSTIGIEGEGEIDDFDFKILKLLALDSRIPTIEIAKKLNSTVTRINNRIKKLIKSGIICSYKVLIDFNKLGFKWFKVDIFLREYSKIQQIIQYIEKNPYLHTVDNTLGYADLELEFLLKDVDQLHQIIEDISTKFHKNIRNYSYFRLVEPHKYLNLDMKKLKDNHF